MGLGQALATLKNLSGFLDATIGSLSAASAAAYASSTSVNNPAANQEATLSAILSDLHNLFALISKETTNLSLAFAPPKEHWDAVDGTAKKLNDLSSKVVYGLRLLRGQTTSEDVLEHILAKQWRLASITTFECLMELSNSCITIYTALGHKPIQATQRKRILTNTSLVWKAVERTEKLPNDERSAFVISWKETLETFEDALEEVEELSQREAKGKEKAENQDEEAAEETGHGEEEDDFDFDDLDDDTPISEEELRVVQSVYQYMKLVKALLRNISTLQGESLPFGRIAEFGNRIASCQDELASAIQPPQDTASIRAETRNYSENINSLIKLVMESLSEHSLAKSLERASLTEQKHATPIASPTDSEKWFTMCKQHLDKASLAILALCEDGPER